MRVVDRSADNLMAHAIVSFIDVGNRNQLLALMRQVVLLQELFCGDAFPIRMIRGYLRGRAVGRHCRNDTNKFGGVLITQKFV